MDLKKELQKFDLTPREAEVYMACIELGAASIQHIAEKACVNRVTAYGLVVSLVQKGFLREEYVKNKRKISAYPPMKLYDIVSRDYDDVKRREKALEHIVPLLKDRMKKDTEETHIIYYEGEEGMRNWASDALETKGELLEWTKIESFSDRFEAYLTSYYFPKKFARQIPTRFIFLDTPKARAYVRERYIEDKKASPMKARFISPDQFETPGFMIVFNDRFSIGLPKEMRAVTVADQLVADAQRKIWEFGWLHATDEMTNGKYPLEV
ncbi:MAG: helix-turn-helix domain-containing protein [Patescibacteria group bacterium]